MKKPFKDMNVFAIVKSLVIPALKGIPGVGPIVQNIVDKNSTPEGIVDNKELMPQLVSLGVLIVLAYLVLSGRISWADAEQVREFIK